MTPMVSPSSKCCTSLRRRLPPQNPPPWYCLALASSACWATACAAGGASESAATLALPGPPSGGPLSFPDLRRLSAGPPALAALGKADRGHGHGGSTKSCSAG